MTTPREEILANILHTLATLSRTSPLCCYTKHSKRDGPKDGTNDETGELCLFPPPPPSLSSLSSLPSSPTSTSPSPSNPSPPPYPSFCRDGPLDLGLQQLYFSKGANEGIHGCKESITKAVSLLTGCSICSSNETNERTCKTCKEGKIVGDVGDESLWRLGIILIEILLSNPNPDTDESSKSTESTGANGASEKEIRRIIDASLRNARNVRNVRNVQDDEDNDNDDNDDNNEDDGLCHQCDIIFDTVQKSMESVSNEPISPHVLLRTVKDSYYFYDDCDGNGNDGGLGSLTPTAPTALTAPTAPTAAAAQDANSQHLRHYKLPTPLALFHLRSLLLSHALHCEVARTQQLLNVLDAFDGMSSTSSTNNNNNNVANVANESSETGETGKTVKTSETGKTGKTIRWRRLKSMVDDALAFFRRVLLDFLRSSLASIPANVADAANVDSSNEDLEDLEVGSGGSGSLSISLPIFPMHVVSISTWIYTQHVFPACGKLLSLILSRASCASRASDASDASNGTKPQNTPTTSEIGGAFLTNVLETCQESFHVCSSLLALLAMFGGPQWCSSQYIPMLLHCINDSFTNDLFERRMLLRDNGGGYRSYIPHIPRGLTLEEDMLCYPWIGEAVQTRFKRSKSSLSNEEDTEDDTEDDTSRELSTSATHWTHWTHWYDPLGIAVIAYCRLRAEGPSQAFFPILPVLPVLPLPYPYTNERRWDMLFPHVATLFQGSESSATISSLQTSEDDIDDINDDNDGGDIVQSGNRTIVLSGLDMLQTLISKRKNNHSLPRKWKYDRRVAKNNPNISRLELTFKCLIDLTLQTFASEGMNDSGSNIRSPFQYSSSQLLTMMKDLIHLSPPRIQIQAVSLLCPQMKCHPKIMLLPCVLDWLRSLVSDMCREMQRCAVIDEMDGSETVDSAVVAAILSANREIVDVLSPFIEDLNCTFEGATSPLPKNVSEFMGSIETYTSIFSLMRLQKLFIVRCQMLGKKRSVDTSVLSVLRWMEQWFDKSVECMKQFDICLSRLIDFWSSSSPMEMGDPPSDWHKLFLLRHSLNDVLSE